MEWKKRSNHAVDENQAGQAILEFTLALLISISFLFFYVKLAAVFAIGNYIHYVTFMGARSYLASHFTKDDQQAAADLVIGKMLGTKWRRVLKPNGGNTSTPGAYVGSGTYFEENPYQNAWNQGVTFSFKPSVSLYPWDGVAPPIEMNLVSTSWLGREDSVDECRVLKNKIQTQLKSNTGNQASNIYWENGNDGC